MIGCVIAMESEAAGLLKKMRVVSNRSVYGRRVRIGQLFGKDIALTISGVGKVNAAVGACAVLLAGAKTMLNIGTAGGLIPERCTVGELYLINKVVQYDFDLSEINGTEVGTLDGERENLLPLFLPEGLDLPERVLGTGDRFDDSPRDHDLLVRLGCEIRDMEAGAIAQVCKYAGDVPFCSVKVISDVYGSGATTEQFRSNLRWATGNLSDALPDLFRCL